jgi:large subunit ribosomal protein L34e
LVGVKKKTKARIEREGRYGRFKSRRSHRMLYVKAPGNKTVIQFRERMPKPAKCASCGAVLKGVACERPYKMQKIAKSRKKVSRAYGGYLCPRCLKRKVIRGARS